MNGLAVASTFSGVGGIDLGFQSAGIPTRLLCEYDKHAAAVLARRFPGVPIHPDVTELTADDLHRAGLVPESTILAGGFPCQDLSVAGARRGMGEGTRSGLYWHLDRLMGEFRPAWVVFENVPGLLSSNDGRDMGAVLGSLAKRGYGFAYRVLDAQFFGVPQRRRRVVIVGRLGDSGAAPAQVLLEPEGGGWNPPAGFPSWPRTAGDVARGTGGAGREVANALTAREGKEPDSDATTTLIVNSLTAANGGADDNMAQANHLVPVTFQKTTRPATSEHPDVWEHREVAATLSPFDLGSESRAVELVVEDGRHLVGNSGAGRVLPVIDGDEGGEVADGFGAEVEFHASTLAADSQANQASSRSQFGNGPVTVLGDRTHALTAEGHDASEDGTGRGTPIVTAPQVAATLTAGVSKPGTNPPGRRQEDDHNLVAETQATVRRLTPLECERLQGHPDNWTEGQADSHRYKQMGNGVAVPVFEWVARRLRSVHEGGAP